MEEIIQEALGKGVEMHVAGELDLASQLYASVIKLQPNHADANHNMGLLKVDTGHDLEALPYLQTALQADPSIAQFWHSYIRALIKLDRVDDAARILSLAQESGVKSEEFLELHQQLNRLASIEKEVQSQSDASAQSKPNIGSHSPPQEAINQLANLYNQGQLSAVVERAKALIKQYPSAFIVWNILGAANKGLGQVDEAVRAFQKVTELNPTYADGFSNLGATLHDQGKAEEAIEAYNRAISLHPDDIKVHYNMGVTLQEYGKLDEALEAYNRAITLKPDYASAFNNMATVLRDQDKLEEAILAYQKVLSIEPDNADAYNNIGVALKEQGKMDQAIEALKKAISLKPDNAEVYISIGVILKEQSKLEEAIEAYKNALSLKPDYAEAYFNIGNAFKDQGKLEEAIEAYKNALSLKPDNAEAYNNMGAIFQDQGQLQQAIAAYKKTLSLKPDYAEAYNNMGAVFQDQGELQEAIAAYKNALLLKPDYAAAHRNLSGLIRYRPNDPQVVAVDEFLRRPDFSDYERCHLHYTYAKMNSDFGELKAAFEHYVAGGALRKKILSYDLEQDKLFFAQIKNTAPKLKELSFNEPFEVALQTPIFILGMPRSGTTLVEQIVSSHSQVHGAGELSFLERFGARLSLGAREINSDNLIKVRTAYLTEIKKVSENKPFLTDKMPHNFLYIGLILKALPEAKIIHVKRDPAATCWSNFKHYFTSEGLGYSYDLDDTRSYYKMYQELMEFWDTIYGDRIYHLYYERLTVEQEIETKKLIEHLELPWEDACLSPQKNKRRVRTASQQQVRKKVYAGSSQNWREYEKFLNGAFKTLYV